MRYMEAKNPLLHYSNTPLLRFSIDFNKPIELDPNDAGVYSNRVISFVLMGLKHKGCSDLRKACEIGYCSGWQWAKEKGY